MRISVSSRWRAILLVALLAFVLFAGKLNFTRIDIIAAVACTGDLWSEVPDGVQIVGRYRDALAAEASRHALPAELQAAIIASHQRQLTPFRRFTDCAGSALGRDLSLGLAQIRISTAVNNDRQDFSALPPRQFRKYRAALLQPEENIRLQAIEVRRLLERTNRYPGITADEVIQNPFIMTLLMSEYRMGRQRAASGASRLSGNAIWDLRYMLDNGVFVFGRPQPDVQQIQDGVRTYLDYLYCERGTFDTEICEDWRQSALRNTGS